MPRRTPPRSALRPVTPEDLRALVFLGDPQLAPDGSAVIYTRKVADKPGTWTSTIHRVTLAGRSAHGGAPSDQPFTHGPRDSRPRWSPDARRVAFIRAADKHQPQICVIDAQGGEARTLTRLPEGSIGDLKWSPDASRVAIAFRATSLSRTHAERTRRERDHESEPPLITEHEWYRLDGDGYFGDDRFALVIVDADTGDHHEVFDGGTLGEFSFDWFPDGLSLAVTANRDPQAMLKPWRTELLRVHARTGRAAKIAGAGTGAKTAVRVSPDGTRIAWAGRDDEEGTYSTENIGLFVLEIAARTTRCITAATDDCLMSVGLTDAAEAVFAPVFGWCDDSKRLLVRIGRGAVTLLAEARVDGDDVKVIARESDHDLDMASISADGRMAAFVRSAADRPAEIAIGHRTGRSAMRIETITACHDALCRTVAFASVRSTWVTAEDGHRSELFEMLPPRAAPNGRHPAVIQIHGGPHARYGIGFFHEFQCLAAAGYAVFFSNPRGSKGYGRDHCAAIRGAWGDRDWADLRAVADHVERHPNVHARRIGIMGGSYGGYMTNWAVAHDTRFRAAITDRCVSNLVSMGGNSDYIELPDRYFPGNFWDQPEARWQQSPIAHFGNVRTPMLIVHSAGDLRCNIEQAEQIFSCLRLRGIPCRFVRYPASTSHGLSRSGPPDLRIHRLNEILAWWKAWL